MRRMTAERRTPNSARRVSTDLFVASFSAPETVGVRPSVFAKRFISKLGSRSESSISAKNSFVTISERRSTTEPDERLLCSHLYPPSIWTNRMSQPLPPCYRLDLGSAAVNEQFDTRDETRFLRSQKQRRLRNFLGFPHASHRDG